MIHFIVLEREHLPPAVIGPYSTEEEGVLALERSSIVEVLTSEDCLDCVLVQYDFERPDVYEMYVVDPDDPDYFGRESELTDDDVIYILNFTSKKIPVLYVKKEHKNGTA